MAQNLYDIHSATCEEIIMSVCWVQASSGGVPPGASQAGQDKDGGKIFVGRAFHGSDVLPCKIIPNHGAAYVSYEGQEISVQNYEVLCHGSFAWAPARDGHVPQDALPVGYTGEGETLYAGRVFHDGTLTVGKVHPSHGVCYIPYGGEEVACNEYEILITHRCH